MSLPASEAAPDRAHDVGGEVPLAVLIAGAARGDMIAFEHLYNRTSPWLLARCRRIAGEAHAEDVLTEVYLQVWRELDTFDALRGEPLAWLAAIARSRALDRLRHERARPTAHASCIDEELEQGHDDGPERQLTQREQHLALQQVMERLLSAKERMVVGLAFYRECTHTEIAALTGMPLGTVKTLLHRSQSKLREELVPGRAVAARPRPAVAQHARL